MNSLKCEANRDFRNKKREYPKGKMNEIAGNRRNKNMRLV
jgi:hypothetical protein